MAVGEVGRVGSGRGGSRGVCGGGAAGRHEAHCEVVGLEVGMPVWPIEDGEHDIGLEMAFSLQSVITG